MSDPSGDRQPSASQLFRFPESAKVDRVLNKERFYAGMPKNRKLKALFTAQVSRVRWAYKLAPETINTPGTVDVPEIEVIHVEASGSELDQDVLAAIDEAIPNPTIHEVYVGDKVRQTAAYKRTSESDRKAWVVSHYVTSQWHLVDVERAPLLASLNLGILYASLLRSMIDVPAREGESLRDHVERHGQLLTHRREAARLEKKINAEKQFNRRVELNSQLRSINQRIHQLSQRTSQEADARKTEDA